MRKADNEWRDRLAVAEGLAISRIEKGRRKEGLTLFFGVLFIEVATNRTQGTTIQTYTQRDRYTLYLQM